jgi:hypothetical protein
MGLYNFPRPAQGHDADIGEVQIDDRTLHQVHAVLTWDGDPELSDKTGFRGPGNEPPLQGFLIDFSGDPRA